MIEFEKPNITKIDENKNWHICSRTTEQWLWVQRLELTSSLLLASLPGAAVTSINIEGVHEFDTVPGVREDVMQIILNVRKLLQNLTSKAKRQLRLDVEGLRNHCW